MNKRRSTRVTKKIQKGSGFTTKQVTLVHTTVAKVLDGKLTRDQAQKLLTDSGVPVLKVDGWVHPAHR